MKYIVSLFSVILVLSLCLGLCACGGAADNGGKTDADPVPDNGGTSSITQIEDSKLTKENVAGTGWQCTYFEGEDKIYRRFTLSAEGEFTAIIAKNELFSHKETGTYDVKDGKLYLYLNGDAASATVYEYKNGNLVNNGNEFTTYVE